MWPGNMYYMRDLRSKQNRYRIHLKMLRAADNVIKNCAVLAGELPEGPDRKFIQSLRDYLSQRQKETSFLGDNDSEIAMRSDYIDKILPVVRENKLSEQYKMLDENNIGKFKGKVTQRLYDILILRRSQILSQLEYQSISPPKMSGQF